MATDNILHSSYDQDIVMLMLQRHAPAKAIPTCDCRSIVTVSQFLSFFFFLSDRSYALQLYIALMQISGIHNTEMTSLLRLMPHVYVVNFVIQHTHRTMSAVKSASFLGLS